MRANPIFADMSPDFWAYVRLLSQQIGYSNQKSKDIKIPVPEEIIQALTGMNLASKQLFYSPTDPTVLGANLLGYFKYRSEVLGNFVRTHLMSKEDAEVEFERVKRQVGNVSCPLPMNKQTGEKRNPAFLTGMVNLLMASSLGDLPCNYDPRSLTLITHEGLPVRTLARRVDGAFPSVINPIALWEVKEYYYTTTFGSRIADGVYETLLDGMELKEAYAAYGCKIQHILVIDGYSAWWEQGRSYLCRMIDMLHMGCVDEILFGREIVARVPALAVEWRDIYESRNPGLNFI